MNGRWIATTVSRLHVALLGTGIGDRTATALRGMAWTAPAAVVSRVAAGLATLAVARLVGPAEYGRANVAIAATFWLQIPLFLGIPTALLHHVPRGDGAERSAWSGTGVLLMAGTGALTLLLGVILAPLWSGATGIPQAELRLALAWGAGYFPYGIAIGILAARESFRLRALVEVLFAALYPALLVAAWWTGHLDGSAYVLALAGAYVVVGVLALAACVRHLRVELAGTLRRARMLLSHGLVASGAVLANAMLQGTARLVAGRSLDPTDVGLLSAYQSSSIQMALYFVTFAASVFLPIASRTPSRDVLLRKITRLLAPVAVGSAAFHGVVLAACFLVLGDRYELRLGEWAVFSVAAGLVTSQWLVLWYFLSAGRRGVLAGSVATILAGLVNIAACEAWIPREGVMGAGLAMALAYAVGIGACYLPPIRRMGTGG